MNQLTATESSAALDPELRAAVLRVARVPHLLVACDYDGTIAPIVADPSKAAPSPQSVAALRALSSLPQTSVGVISGRALRDLAALSRLPAEVRLVGSHGSEFDVGFVDEMPEERRARRAELHAVIAAIAKDQPGVRLEAKPASIAVHTRAAPRDVAQRVFDAVRSGAALWPDIEVTTGREVIELSVVPTDKGLAVDALRIQVSASAVVYLGDDFTDEKAFAHLHGPDLGIKVGSGESQARCRVENADEAVAVLELLLTTRRRWLFGEQAVPIERHSMLSNSHTVALLTPAARVTWLCHPKPDSAAIFADLLGDAAAGHFTVSPERGGLPLGQRYRPGTMTVETRWSGLTVTDWLDHHRTGSSLMRVLTGTSKVRVEFVPRPEFGQVHIRLEDYSDNGLDNGLVVLGTGEPTALYSPGVRWEIMSDGHSDSARATIDLNACGGTAWLELRLGTNNMEPPRVEFGERQIVAETAWRDWSDGLKLPSVAREHVRRSALTLRGLWHKPTGAILAAATSSLPEELGGSRNWDYRYCWLRDASLTAKALVDLGSTEEAESLLKWTLRVSDATDGHPERLHPLYTLEGTELGPEAVIESLPGYAGSRPVRVGNAANGQVQLDVFGPVADLIATLADLREPETGDFALMHAMVEAVERRWMEVDHGIWEARRRPRHYVYSKVMCWMTVDRGIQLFERHGQGRPVPATWEDLRAEIRDDVLTNGWNEKVGAYTVAYGAEELDAAALWIGLAGLLEDDNPRFLSTVLAVEAELREGPTVYRYRWNDGLPGVEGGFHLCTAWLIEAYLRTGRRADAEELFGQLLECAGPTGLLPEEYDPMTERALGNHPQAYSHLGLIRCALELDRS